MTMRQQVCERDIRPGPSSQTTTVWPLSMTLGEGQGAISHIGLDNAALVVLPVEREAAPWSQVVDRVLCEHRDLWERLADR